VQLLALPTGLNVLPKRDFALYTILINYFVSTLEFWLELITLWAAIFLSNPFCIQNMKSPNQVFAKLSIKGMDKGK
jgi:hypothetical protein